MTGFERLIKKNYEVVDDFSKFVVKYVKCPICDKHMMYATKKASNGVDLYQGGCTGCEYQTTYLQHKENENKASAHDVAAWSKAIMKIEGYKCRICGSEENLEAHHILEKSKYPEYRTTIGNGVCLCRECHNKIHAWRINNTKGE